MSPRELWPVDEELGVGRRNVSIGRLFKHFHLNLPESCCPETLLRHPSHLCWLLPVNF